MNNSIAMAVNQQKDVVSEINVNLVRVNEAAEETSAGADHTSNVTRALVEESTSCKRLISEFRRY